MKRILSILLVLLLSIFALTGCEGLLDFEISNEDLGLPCVHEYEKEVTEPTCTAEGFTTYTCKLCQDTYTDDETAVVAHDYVEGVCSACGAEDPDYVPPVVAPEKDKDLESAYNFVHQNVVGIEKVTGASYEIINSATIAGKTYSVVWEVSDERVSIVAGSDENHVKVVIPKSSEEFDYVLKFTVTNEKGEALSREYIHTVPVFAVSSFEEYMAAKEGDNVTVMGVVVAINSKSLGNTRNHLFLADLNTVGGYYSYQMDQDPVADLGIEVGMTVTVNGPVAPYSGMQEIKGGIAEIIDTNKTTVDFVDATEDFANGDNLAKYTALPVVIKGVTIGTQELGGTSEYLFFSLNGHQSYVRTYVTDFPSTLKVEDKATIDAAHKEHFDWTADVYGIVVLYNSNPYLIPLSVDCFEYLGVVEKSPEEKVAAELNNLKVPAKVTADSVLELGAVGALYSDVTFAWASDSEYAVVDGGKITIKVPDSETVVTLTLTVTCGEATGTKEYKVTLSKTPISVSEAISIGSAMEHNTYTTEKYLVGGVIVEVYNTQYGNMKIKDAEGNILTIYGTYDANGDKRYDAMENAPVAGDYVLILGAIGQYNGTPQIKNGWIVSRSVSVSIKDANDTGLSMENNAYTDEKYLITGEITEIANDKYGNMYIKDAEGNTIYIYGLYDAIGATRYDSLATKPAVGDTITVLSAIGKYNDAAQLKNVWLVDYKAAGTGDGGEGGGDPVIPPVGDKLEVVDPVAGTAYYLGLVNTNKGTDVYFISGGMAATYYFATSSDASAALKVYLEATEGGYYLYVVDGESKLYVNFVASGTFVNSKYEDAPATVFTYDATLKTVVTTVNSLTYALGTRNDKDYTTVGPVDISRGSFICNFYAASAGGEGGGEGGGDGGDPVIPPVGDKLEVVDPVAGTAYYLGLVNTNKGTDVYFISGGMAATYYFATSSDASAALKVYLEATEGGYYLYVVDGESKLYVNFVASGTFVNSKYEAAPTTVFTYDATLKTVVTTVNSLTYALGTRNDKDYTTVGPVDVSRGSFICNFYAASAGGETPHEHDYEAVITAPTCDEKGYTTYTCSCGHSYVADEVAATGHSYVDGVCSACGKKEPSGEAETTTVTVVIADYATANGWSNSKLFDTVVLDDNITVAVSGTPVGTYGQNTGKFYTSDNTWRIYQNENPSVTFTAAEGATIVSVKITYKVKNGGTLTLGSENIASDTVVSVNGSTVTFSVTSATATNGQAQITAIEVVYSTAGGSETPDCKHNYESVTTDPTCTEAGLVTYTCSLCGDSYTEEGEAATGHTPGAEATCTAPQLCTVCGAEVAGVTDHSYDNGICTVCGDKELVTLTSPEEGKAYKFGLVQVKLGKTLYITGVVSGRYLATTEDYNAAADVYAEATESGYKFYIVVDGANQYIEVYFNADNKISVQYAENGSVFTYDATTNSWATNVDGTDYYLGTYNNFDTISASKTSYISAENTGVSQFPANLYQFTHVEIVEPEFEGSGTQDDPYLLPDTGDYSVAYEGGYSYVWYQLSFRNGGYFTISSEYADAWLMIGTDVYNTVNSGMYGPSITVYVPAGTPCYFGIGTSSDEAAEVPFTVSYKEFTSESYEHLVGAWKGEVIPSWNAINLTISVDENGTGTITEDGGYYTDTFTISFILVDGNKVTFFATNEYGNAPAVTEFTYDAESDTLVSGSDVLSRFDGEDDPVIDPDVTYDTVIVIGNNVLYFSADEIAADTATRTLTITVAGDYMFAAGNLFVSAITDADGNAIAKNEDYSFTLAEGEYTVTFSMLSMFGVQADTACDLEVKVPSETGEGGEGGEGGEDDPTYIEPYDPLKDSLGGFYNFDGYTVYLFYNSTLGEYFANVYGDGYDLYFTYVAEENENGSYTLTLEYYAHELEVNPDMAETILGFDIVIGGACEHNYVLNDWYHPAMVSATCITPGTAVYECELCGDYYTVDTEIDPTAHENLDYDNGVVVSLPDCATMTDGITNYTCLDCGATVETVEYASHSLDETVVPATCTEDGSYYAQCSVCGYEESNVIEATGHYNWYLTCGESGECMECGEQFTIEHDLSNATCTSPAMCFNCWETFGDINPDAHNFIDGVCIECGEVLICSHENITHVEACDPSCHQNGCVEFWYCVVCDTVYTDAEYTQVSSFEEVIIPYTAEIGHVDAVEASCHQNGSLEYWYCTECDAVFADADLTQLTNRKNLTIPYTAEIVHVDAVEVACHQNGNLEYWYCADCQAVFTDAALTQLSNFKSVVVPYTAEIVYVPAVEAACHQYGNVEYWYCADCQAVFTDVTLTQLSNFKSVVVPYTAEIIHVDAVEATCTENGNLEYWYCAECQALFTDAALTQLSNFKSVVVPAGHVEVVDAAVEATCTTAGKTEGSHCDRCGEVFTAQEEIGALGHTGYEADYKCDACSAVLLPEDGTALTIPQALTIAQLAGTSYTTQKYYITGTIKNVYNTTYGNLYLVDADGNEICIYGLYSYEGTRYDAMEYKPVAGDELTVYTVLGMYGTTKQGKNATMDDVVAHEHDYVDAVTAPTCVTTGYTTHTCTICNYAYVDAETEALGHTTDSGVCDNCGLTIGGDAPVIGTLATFDFGANGSASHVDGNDYGTSKSFTSGTYTLALTGMSKVYGPAYDAKGNSCIKLGTSKVAGTFSFTVDENVTEVVIYVAKYKANTSKISVNGTAYTLSGASNNGEYDEIVIDTTTNKTVTFSTVSGGVRCMVNTIVFKGQVA